MASNPKTGEPSWKWRRVMTFAVMAFAGWQLHRLTSMPDTRVNDTIAWGWQVIMSVLAFGYTGFATAQDLMGMYVTRSGRPYADQVQSVDAPPPAPVIVAGPAPQTTVNVGQQQPADPNAPPPGFAG